MPTQSLLKTSTDGEKPETGSNGTPLLSDAMELLRQDFPYHCRNLRMNLNWSLARMAFEMGIGESPDNHNRLGKMTISRWESGAHVPQERYLVKFMEIQNKYDSQKTSNVQD